MGTFLIEQIERDHRAGANDYIMRCAFEQHVGARMVGAVGQVNTLDVFGLVPGKDVVDVERRTVDGDGVGISDGEVERVTNGHATRGVDRQVRAGDIDCAVIGIETAVKIK